MQGMVSPSDLDLELFSNYGAWGGGIGTMGLEQWKWNEAIE